MQPANGYGSLWLGSMTGAGALPVSVIPILYPTKRGMESALRATFGVTASAAAAKPKADHSKHRLLRVKEQAWHGKQYVDLSGRLPIFLRNGKHCVR